jgi:hypothetical protein
MLRVTRTFLGIAVQTAKYLGSPHTVVPYSTVNESLTDPLVVPYQPSPPTLGAEISGSYDAITDTDSLRLQLMVIGNQGHRLIAGPPATTTEVPHKGTDAGLYGLIPFVAKPVTNDLTALQRTKYRLRKTMMIDGILYAVYYGRVIDISGITPTTQLTRIVDGTPVTTNFSPTINNLRPPVPAIGIDNDGSYVNVSSPLTVEFTDEEVTLLKEAAALVFGNENYAIISEIGDGVFDIQSLDRLGGVFLVRKIKRRQKIPFGQQEVVVFEQRDFAGYAGAGGDGLLHHGRFGFFGDFFPQVVQSKFVNERF